MPILQLRCTRCKKLGRVHLPNYQWPRCLSCLWDLNPAASSRLEQRRNLSLPPLAYCLQVLDNVVGQHQRPSLLPLSCKRSMESRALGGLPEGEEDGMGSECGESFRV